MLARSLPLFLLAGRIVPVMKDGRQRCRTGGLGRRLIAMLAALTLCLNIVLPVMVMATTADASQPVGLCVPDGQQATRYNQDGESLPAQQKHECSGCAIHHGFASFVAIFPTISTVAVPDSLSAIRPEKASRRSVANKHGSSDPRGPPHLT